MEKSPKMKMFTQILAEASNNIAFKATLALRDGLKHGAENFMLDGESDAKKAFSRTKYSKAFDQRAYILGFNTAFNKEFSAASKKNKSLVKMAVDKKAVTPVGWELFQDRTTGRWSIEQE